MKDDFQPIFNKTKGFQSMFPLRQVCEIIIKNNFKIVTLQFPDEVSSLCVEVYDEMTNILNEFFSSPEKNDIEVFIATDSTYGSSVDDVSALHVDSQVLVYFGSDLSSSGVMPVIVVPEIKTFDISACVQIILQNIEEVTENILVLYEPCYSQTINEFSQQLKLSLDTSKNTNVNIVIGHLPRCADLANWGFTENMDESGDGVIGGLRVSESVLGLSPSALTLLFVGEKPATLSSVSLHRPAHALLALAPATGVCVRMRGQEARAHRERAGQMLRVRDAECVGVLLGSMGLSAHARPLLLRMRTLLRAAGKRSLCLALGRLNEAKLANFPEIDLFCLIANDDEALIPPKTFHVPVVTPWELELGLGARDWDSVFKVSSGSVLDDVSLAEAEARVRKSFSENNIDSDDELGGEGEREAEEVEGARVTKFESREVTDASLARGTDYFSKREFRGLQAQVDEDQAADLAVHQGRDGIASDYK